MSTSQKWWTAAVVLVALGLAAWWFWSGDDLARMKALQAQMRDDSLSDDARRALFQQFREGMRGLSREEREQLFAGLGRRGPNLDEFFALPPKQRTAFLDREINKSEQRRRQMQAQGPRGNQGPPGGFGGGNRSSAEREAARKRRLDDSSPEDRAQRAEYRRLMDERRTARGMEPSGRRG